MGKNFSGNTNPTRHKSDFYQTPYNLTRRLLEVEKFEGSILEPACGNGAIVSVYVFSKHFKGQPEIYWLDNNDDVLKKGKP